MEAAALARETAEKLRSADTAMKQAIEKKEAEAAAIIRETEEK